MPERREGATPPTIEGNKEIDERHPESLRVAIEILKGKKSGLHAEYNVFDGPNIKQTLIWMLSNGKYVTESTSPSHIFGRTTAGGGSRDAEPELRYGLYIDEG